jgi:hypothetical protein
MPADLDLLLSTVFVTALRVCDSSSRVVLPFRQKINASATCPRVAQAARVLQTPPPAGGHVRPGFHDDLLLLDSTPVGCARSRETVKRSAHGDAADYGWCASHSRYFWGLRPHAISAPDGTPRALALRSPNADEREIGLTLPDRGQRHGREVPLGDGGHASHGFAAQVAKRDATSMRPCRKHERGTRPRLPADRIDPLDPQQPPHPRTLLLPRRRDHPQPPTRTQQPCTRRPHRLTARNQQSSARPSLRRARHRGRRAAPGCRYRYI